uniref:TIL domain-containing protein n=1 Tax=Steinernema glaseri TaxID=37863 RepID=A0A1I7ZGM0_9BILA
MSSFQRSIFVVFALLAVVYCQLRCGQNELLTRRQYKDQYCNATIFYQPPRAIGEERCVCFRPYARDAAGNCVTYEECAQRLCEGVECPLGDFCSVVKSPRNETGDPEIIAILDHVAGCTLKL